MAYGLNAELPSAIRELGRAIVLFRRLGNRRGLCNCLASRVGYGSGCMTDTTVSALMTREECESDARDAEQLARDMEWPAGLAYVLLQLGRADTAFGMFGQSLSHTREALRIATEIEHQQWTAAACYALGRTYLALLAPGRALPELERGLEAARILGSEVWTGLIKAELVHAYRQRGELPRALTLLTDTFPMDTLEESRSFALAERELALQGARLDLQRGDAEAALAIVSRLYEQVPRSGTDQPVAELLLVEGESLLRLRRFESAEEALEGAKRGAVQRMNPSTLWRAHASLARLHHAAKRARLAVQEWEGASAVLQSLAATIEEQDLRATFLQAALADIPRPVTARVAHPVRAASQAHNMLTPRESEVAHLIAQGKSNHEIADTLVVSERTVTTHVTHILGKLGFTSRAQIVAWIVTEAQGSRSHPFAVRE
jgi:DNA-binding CsgD family transcriptional regulator/tetratricopeptide (TPR) repeat protein